MLQYINNKIIRKKPRLFKKTIININNYCTRLTEIQAAKALLKKNKT